MQIGRPDRQNTKRYSAYLEKPRQCAHPRSPQTQDFIQGRQRSAFKFFQDYLVRAGRQHCNLGPGLFCKVQESNIRDPKEKRRLAQDPGLSNSEQRVDDRVFQVGRNIRHSEDNNAQRLGNNNRPASSFPPRQNSRRDVTVFLLQLQCSLLQLQKNVLLRPGSDAALESSNQDSTRVWLDDRNGKKSNQSRADSIVLRLAVEHQDNDIENDNIPKEASVEAAKKSDGISQEKETRKNKGLGIGSYRDPIHNSINQTRLTSHQVASKAERQGSSQQRLEQVDPTQQEHNNKYNMVDQQTISQSTIVLYESKQMDNDPNKCFELSIGVTLIREIQEKVFPFGEWKDNNIWSSNQREVTAILKALLEFHNTVTIYCFNKGKGSITIVPLVDQILNLAEQQHKTIEVGNILGFLNTVPDSISLLSRYGDQVIKREILQKTLMKLRIQIFINIFATRANRQCKRYCKLSKEVPLLNSPISKLQKTIRKVKKQRVSIAILVAPDWPNQKRLRDIGEIATQNMFLDESTQILFLRVKYRNKGQTLPPGLINLFQWKQKQRIAFQTTVTSQRTEFQCGLTLLAEFLKRINQHQQYLLDLGQPQIFMANYHEDAINQKCLDKSVKIQRYALAVLLKFIGYPDQQIRFDLVKELKRKIRKRLRQIDKEKQI
ncbi:MAG: hypothetical protein EZS28_007742 [Streblomastix strix]|uniref:Uncharacterized protein n=1 Tax=Streblomastix strix TaxID=222440 RepID=A0A5J4WRN0_9EUKA|nr:MAG: hypothetical protein EZS28_007742 [Streblomastix strix]